MKRTILILSKIIVILCVVFFSACRKEVAVTGVLLNKNEMSLTLNETESLFAIVEPKNATNKNVIWKSNDINVVTITENGLVKANKEGNAIITVITQDGQKTAHCFINVDYRNKWTGTYDFTTIDYKQYCLYYPCDSLFRMLDTVSFVGTVEKYKTSRLKIIFKPNATEPFPIHGLMYPVVDDIGNLSYPEYDCDTISGRFSINNIYVRYSCRGPLGIGAYYWSDIQGKKIICN